jgi:transcriptional regulator with XRE-family HTH domain
MEPISYNQKLRDRETNRSLADKQNIDLLNLKISQMVKIARIEKGYTQIELAEKLNTKQSSIARLESGKNAPTITFLNDIAIALDTYMVEPRFKMVEHYYYNPLNNTQLSAEHSGVTFSILRNKKLDNQKPFSFLRTIFLNSFSN